MRTFINGIFVLASFSAPLVYAGNESPTDGFLSGEGGIAFCNSYVGTEGRLKQQEDAAAAWVTNARKSCDGKTFLTAQARRDCEQEVDEARRNSERDTAAARENIRQCQSLFNAPDFKVSPTMASYCRGLIFRGVDRQGLSPEKYVFNCISSHAGKEVAQGAAEKCSSLPWEDLRPSVTSSENSRLWRNASACYNTIAGGKYDKVLLAACSNLDPFSTTACLDIIKDKSSEGITLQDLNTCERKQGSDRVSCLGLIGKAKPTPVAPEPTACGGSREEVLQLRAENQVLLRLLERSAEQLGSRGAPKQLLPILQSESAQESPARVLEAR